MPPRHCHSCFKSAPHSGFLSPRSENCRDCATKELEKQNRDYFVERNTGKGFSDKINDGRRKPNCVVCKKIGYGHEDKCAWNPSKRFKGTGLHYPSTYVPKTRYEYLCGNGHNEITNLPPEKAFCPSCRTTEMRLIMTINTLKKEDDGLVVGNLLDKVDG